MKKALFYMVILGVLSPPLVLKAQKPMTKKYLTVTLPAVPKIFIEEITVVTTIKDTISDVENKEKTTLKYNCVLIPVYAGRKVKNVRKQEVVKVVVEDGLGYEFIPNDEIVARPAKAEYKQKKRECSGDRECIAAAKEIFKDSYIPTDHLISVKK